jgi:hypothetical protein
MKKSLFKYLGCFFLIAICLKSTTLTKQVTYLKVEVDGLQKIGKDASGNPINWCRTETFQAQNTAIVIGSQNERVYFFSDKDNCPKLNDINCQNKSYLIAGDELITSQTYNEFTCGKYKNTIGWLASAKLKINELDHNPPIEKWVGNWVQWGGDFDLLGGSIEIHKTANNQLIAKGIMNYRQNTGEFEGTANPKGNELVISEGNDKNSCKVSMLLLGNFLLVDDNSNCGGLNVTFGFLEPLVKKNTKKNKP